MQSSDRKQQLLKTDFSQLELKSGLSLEHLQSELKSCPLLEIFDLELQKNVTCSKYSMKQESGLSQIFDRSNKKEVLSQVAALSYLPALSTFFRWQNIFDTLS